MALKHVFLVAAATNLAVGILCSTATAQTSRPGPDPVIGTVKLWNSIDGWGYVTVDGMDVFVDLGVVERAGAGRLVKGESVRVKLSTGPKGQKRVSEIELLQ